MSIISNIKNAYKVASYVLNNNIERFASKNNLNNSDAVNDWINNRSIVTTKTSQIALSTGNRFYSYAYDNCPQLQSIISKKSNSVIRGRLVAKNDKGDLLPSNNTWLKNVNKVLDNPNIYQNRNQFIQTIHTFMQVYGVSYVYKIKLGNRITGLIVIPNNCIQITWNYPTNILSNTNNLAKYYTVTIFGQSFTFKGDNIELIEEIQDSTLNLCVGKEMQPKSRIDSIRQSVINIIGSLESRNSLITKRGADVLMSPQGNDIAQNAITIDSKERERLQQEYARYGLLSDQWHTLISKVPMNVSKIGMTANEIGLFDGENQDHRNIANAFGVPIPIISLPDTTKYNTYLEAKKEFYEDTIIPESENIAQLFDVIFESSLYGYKLVFDYSHLEFMQSSRKDKASTYSLMANSVAKLQQQGIYTTEQAQLIMKEYE